MFKPFPLECHSLCSAAQSCPTRHDPMVCSRPGSFVHGIFQARILKWVAFPPPGDLPDSGIKSASLRLLHWQVDSLPLSHLGSSGED